MNNGIKNSNVLDLYSGIGSFGIECLSREAKKVTFVEKDSNAIKILEKNLSNLAINEKSLIVFDKIENFFFKKENFEKFDIIFLDPPFAENEFIKDLQMIKRKKNIQKEPFNYIA